MSIHDRDLIAEMHEKIRVIRKTALELKGLSGGIQAVDCNVDRILSSAKMLEVNVGDALEVSGDR